MSSLHEDLKQIDIQNEYLDNEVFTSQEILQLALIVTGISMFLYGFWSGTAAACFLVGFGATLTVSRIRAARTRHAIERAWHQWRRARATPLSEPGICEATGTSHQRRGAVASTAEAFTVWTPLRADLSDLRQRPDGTHEQLN